nr:MAG TPA: hypothetical protein [Caudoviricetes sp.]
MLPFFCFEVVVFFIIFAISFLKLLLLSFLNALQRYNKNI